MALLLVFTSLTACSLTGESEPQRKTATFQSKKAEAVLFELENMLFMGTSVISGSGVALVIRTGDGEGFTSLNHKDILTILIDAFIATITEQLNKKRPLNSFQRGIRNVSYMMIAFMLVMVPIVSPGSWTFIID